MPSRFSRRILDHIADRRYVPSTIDELMADLQIPDDQRDLFRKAVAQLADAGQVVLGASDRVSLPPPGRTMVGVFRGNERGFGFLIPDSPTEHGDLFIPPGDTMDAMTGDRVRARVIRADRGGGRGAGKSPYVGRVVEILQRSDRNYVGTLLKRGNLFIVELDGKGNAGQQVVIRDPHAKDAKPGDKVVIEMVTYADSATGEAAEGVITEVLGEAGEPEAETLSVIRAYGLAEKFPPQVIEEARNASKLIEQDIPPDREDLTKEFILTIDPPDARDFDDAISLRRINEPNGAVWELGVHIADVSYFVRPGSALDEEAKQRGNSTYLPRKVIPMLPEVLSNGVCSLQEGVPRYTKSCFIQYNAEGRPVAERFSKSVIRSAKRLTYLEAQALIDGDLREAIKHARTEPKYPKQLIEQLKLMDELAKTIRQRRLKDGMIVLGLPQVDLVFDDSGRVIDAVPEDDAFTHTLIEMFMVEANEAAARVFDRLNVPMIRRVHPDPDAHDVTELRQFARVAGYNIPQRPSRKELQTLLDSVRGKPAQHAVHLAVLKTLSKAEYSPMLVGHFALASEHYTHFTSPIRRYPDLIVHRGLDAFIEAKAAGNKGGGGRKKSGLARAVAEDPRVPSEEELHKIGRHCSNTEVNSEAAERELRNYLVLELLSNHLGEDFEGVVTGVTGSGVFVQLDKYLVEGFVRLDELPGSRGAGGERWSLNRTTGALVAQRSGRAISIGTRFTVRIASVDLPRRKMELVVLDTKDAKASATRERKQRKQPEGAKQAHQKAMRFKSGFKKAAKERDTARRKQRRRKRG